jgi:uncharacterized protein (TIRG00374 family)
MGLRGLVRRFGLRAAGLVVTAAGLYVVAPSVLALFDAWPQLGDVRPVWFGVVGGLEAASFASLWLLLRISLPGCSWGDVAASQLAGNAATRVIPGGAASGGVVQARMLVQSGQSAGAVGAALTATGLLSTGVLLTLPVLTIPALVVGPPPRQLQRGLVVSLVLAAVIVALGLALLRWDGFVSRVAAVVARAVHVVRRRVDAADLAVAIVAERDVIAAAFRGRWPQALASAAGNRMLDYSALVAALVAVGAQARPSLVLVAYVGALALGMIPITPGGLGFVETGLTTLLVLAGVAADQAVVGTLLYRLASFWLPIPVGVLAWGAWRAHPTRR